MQDIPSPDKWTKWDYMWHYQQPDSSGDEVINPNDDDDEFEDFKPEPEPDLPWWAPLRHLIPYIPYLPITPLGMNLESNMNIDNLDLNFLIEVKAPEVRALEPEVAQQVPIHFLPRSITTNDQGSDTPPNNGEPPKWAWRGPGLPYWLDPDGDGVPNLPPGLLRIWRKTGQLGRWIQQKNGDWYYEDWTKEFQYPSSHPNAPGWSDYFLHPGLLWDELFR